MHRLLASLIALTLLTSACGSDTEDIVAAEPDPVPVEPDGGIGDGAGPLPGAEAEIPGGDWHGPQVAETNCLGMSFVHAEASAFVFSVPDALVDQDAQGIDSEVGHWANFDGSITVSYDYGWYSGSPEGDVDATDSTSLDYSGVEGIKVGAETWVSVYFAEVEIMDRDPQTANALVLTVSFSDPADRIIGECIVASIDWT